MLDPMAKRKAVELTYDQWLLAKHGTRRGEPGGVQGPSFLFQQLMEMQLTGQISATQLQAIAGAMLQDAQSCNTHIHPEMQRLAVTGASGRHPNNVWRDVKRALDRDSNVTEFPKPAMINNVPVLDPHRSDQLEPRVKYVDWPIFLLQDLMHWSYHQKRPEFVRRFLGSEHPEALAQYWRALRSDDPRLVSHPIASQPGWQEHAIPGRIHGDGVPFGKSRNASMDVINVSSVLATGETMDVLNLWFWMPKALMTDATLDRLWKVAIWDLAACLRGEFLPYDWDGHEIQRAHSRFPFQGRICGPYAFAVIQFVGDTDFLSNRMGLKHWQSLQPCDWCPATSVEGSSLTFSDFRAKAPWKSQCVCLEQWQQDMTPHLLWRAHAVLGITLFSICLDILHVLDLGVLQYFLGSHLWQLVHDSALPGSFEQRVDHIYMLFKHACREAGIPNNERLHREDFAHTFGTQTGPTPSHYPCLHGKAARIHNSLEPFIEVTKTIQREQGLRGTIDQCRLQALLCLNKIYTVLRSASHAPSPQQARQCEKACDEFLLYQNSLSMHFWNLHRKLYNITFKSHLLWHLSRQVQYFNCMHGWSYRDESFVGYIANIVRGCIKGGGVLNVGCTLAERWVRLQYFRMRRRERAVFC